MGLSDTLKKAASNAAYAAGYGVGKAGKALRDAAEDPRVHAALANARQAAGKAADATESFAERMAPKLRAFADRAAPVVQDAADQAVATVKEAARKAEPAVRRAAAQAGAATSVAAHRAGEAAKRAGTAAGEAAKKAGAAAGEAVRSTVVKAAADNAAGMRAADARPHEVVDPATGQRVVVEAYVRRPDGARDYGAVYPKGAMGDFGPLGNKAVGMLLILAGVPMLVLPGPGVAAIAAGLYYLRKGGDEDAPAAGAEAAGRGAAGAGAGASGRRRAASSADVVPATGVVVTDAEEPASSSASAG